MDVHCSDPAALREGDLAAALDGAPGPHVSAHLAACPACADQLAALRAAAATLQAALGREGCLEPDTLLAHAAGWLDPGQGAAAERHLAGCIACQAELRLIRETGAESQPAPRRALPFDAAPLFGARRLPAGTQPGMALRGDGDATLIFEADGYHLTLALLREPDGRWTIQGTLLATGPEQPDGPTPVYLIRQGAIVASDELDELGFFTLSIDADATYSLHIDTLPQPMIVAELALTS